MDWIASGLDKNPRGKSRVSAYGSRTWKGELAAIAIALEENADAVLMDDRAAIREGRRIELNILTTLTVLELAAIADLMSFEVALEDLSKTSFRMPPDETLNEYLRRSRKRKRRP